MKCTMDFSSTTAILLFAQSNTVESALKAVVSRKKQNDALWSKMNQRALQTVHKTNLPYFISNENSQQGNTFGEKLSHAIETVFDQGFDKVIVIGNDSPGLTKHHLLRAKGALEDNDWVFGPDYNGGTYLIGVSKAVFDKEKFININWQTSKVFTELKALSSGNSLLLSHLSDFNSLDDLRKLLQDFSFYSTFTNGLLAMLFYQYPLPRILKKRYTFEIVGFNFNKGSPVTT